MMAIRTFVIIGSLCVACGVLVMRAPAADKPAAPARSVRADGVILIDGKPFFPLGIYHDALDADYYGTKFLHDLDVIADAGFNLAHVSMDFTQDGDDAASSTAGKAAALAKKRQMYLGVGVYLKNLDAVVAEQAKWPAILFTSLGDDFNSDAKGTLKGPAKFPPEKMRELSERAKKIAPGLLTYSSGSAYKGASMEGYGPILDAIAVQCYPIGDGSQSAKNELEAMDDVVANYWKAAGPTANKALIVNPQAFAYPGHKWPTPEEMRLQAWISLLDGAKGLIWYSYLSYGERKKTLPESNPKAWEELKTLLPELKQRTEYFTDGQLTKIDNPKDSAFDDGPGTWHAGYWTLGKKRLVVAINTRRTKEVAVDLAIGGGGRIAPAFAKERYPTHLQWADGHLKGSLAPASVEVFEITE